MRRRALLVLACGLLAGAGPDAPAAPIAAFNDALLAGMKAGGTTAFASRAAALAPFVERAFDLAGILQASVGPRWNSFSAAQRQEALDAFRAFTIATWVANFDRHDGETLEILGERRRVGADEVVATRIVPRARAPTRLDYIMRQSAGGWRAVDILLDGTISRVTVQRSDFRLLLADGDPTKLIATLRAKAADHAGAP